MKEKITLIYVLGCGRSGSTILSTVLGAHSETFQVAELMHIYEYGCYEKKSNDGYNIFESPFWSKVLEESKINDTDYFCKQMVLNNSVEYHTNFIKLILGFFDKEKISLYLNEQEKLIESISKVSGKKIIVDSSKYPNRCLLLLKSKKFNVKVIYNIRDVRGVINSFSKKVQTSRNPFSTLIYYNVINVMSQLVFFKIKKNNRLKIKYEQLVGNQEEALKELFKFLNLNFNDVLEKINNNEEITIGPVIEGNRLAQSKKITLKKDYEWITKFSLLEKVIYYLGAFPIMVYNKYPLLKKNI